MSQDNAKKIHLWVDALLLLIISAFFLSHSWQKWADPIIDFGREVYVPWRITLGEVLYKDMAFLYGAFPPCWNALLFKIFGPSILTLAVFNIFIIGVQTFLIYRLCYRLFDRLSALTSAIVFLCLFAFNQHMAQNMYYITPYSHSYFYSLFFGFCSISILHSYTLVCRAKKLFFLGMCLGLMLLSRMEIFLTLIVPLLIGLIIFIRKNKIDVNSVLRAAVAFLSGFYLPVIAFLIYFSKYFSFPDSLFHIIGYNPNWKAVSGIYFYQFTAGLIGWQTNLKLLAITVVWYAALFLGLHVFCKGMTLRTLPKKRLISSALIVCAIGGFAYTVHVMGTYHVSKIFRGQAIFIVLLMTFYLKMLLSSSDKKTWPRALVVMVFGAWALLMLYKVPLLSVNYYYGRFHCLAGVIVSVVYLTSVLPSQFEIRYRLGWVVKTLIFSFLMIVCIINFGLSIKWADLRYIPLGQGANKMWAYDKAYAYGEGPDVEKFLNWAETNIKTGETFVTFPEGIMLNFLTCHPISGPHVTFMPVEMKTYSEEAMLKTLAENPPDYFIFANRDLSIYGNIAVGQNYATDITGWVNNHYTYVWSSSNNFLMREFAIHVYRHNKSHDQ